MPSQSYDPLSQEESLVENATKPAQQAAAARPPIYYGDGPFDVPDSDEEEEAFLEKPHSPRPATGVRIDANDDEELGLYVGRASRVRAHTRPYLDEAND